MTDRKHAPDRVTIVQIARLLTRATSGDAVARDLAIASLTELVQAPTEDAWLTRLLTAWSHPPVTGRRVPTVSDEEIPARIEGRIVHAYLSKSSKSGAGIAFILVASALDPAVIYGPIMLFRSKDIRCAIVSDVIWTFIVGQPTAEARAARDGGLRPNGTMTQND